MTLLDPKEALLLSLEHIKKTDKKEFVSLFEGNNRVLAEDIFATRSLPSFHNSCVDGYGVKLKDANQKLKVFSKIFPGEYSKDIELKDGFCHKIMTGAMIPKTVETVVPIEDVVLVDEYIKLPENLILGENIRKEGEEIKKGEILLKKGTLLTSKEIAALASQGVSTISVYQKIRAGIFSSGDELIEPWEKAEKHQIYNSNSIGIYSFLKEIGCESVYIGSLPDDKTQLKEKINNLKNFDLIVTSGGVSVGDADYTLEVFKDEGMDLIFHRVAIKPGKHCMMGKLGKSVVIGLPGNPLSALSMFLVFVAPIIGKLSGRNAYYPSFTTAKIKKTFTFSGERANVIFGKIDDGFFEAFQDYQYNSGMIAPMMHSNGFIITKQGVTKLNKDDEVKVVMPFSLALEDYKDFYNG